MSGATYVRCKTCLGMGYKGRTRPKGWRIETCRTCGGTGSYCRKCRSTSECRCAATNQQQAAKAGR